MFSRKKLCRPIALILTLIVSISMLYTPVFADMGEEFTDFMITVAPSEDGQLLINNQAVDHLQAKAGESVEIQATAKENYEVTTICVTGTEGQPLAVEGCRFVMPEMDVTVSAVFSPLPEVMETEAETELDGEKEEDPEIVPEPEDESILTDESIGGTTGEEQPENSEDEKEDVVNEIAPDLKEAPESAKTEKQEVEENAPNEEYQKTAYELFRSYYDNSPNSYPDSITFAYSGDLENHESPYQTGIAPAATLSYESDNYSWGGHATCFFSVNGYTAFCMNPKMLQPGPGTYSDSYVAAIPASSNMRLAKTMYYGYNGPGDLTKDLYGNNTQTRNAITHVAAAVAFGDTDPYYGLNSGAISQVQSFLAKVDAQPNLDPARNTAYALNVDPGMQTIGWLISSQPVTPPKGYVKLNKASTTPDITNNNSCYSLAGAEYGLYSDLGCTNKIGTLTTDASGNSNSIEVDPGKYYVKELKAPKGFLLDPRVYTVTVTADQTATVSVKDEPGNDPMAITLSKIDQDSGGTTTQGVASLEGAQFTVCYYDGFYNKDNLPGTATRTWVLQTKAIKNSSGKTEYRTMLSNSYKVTGDAFYYTEGNPNPTLPVGTISVEETKAPTGYLLDGAYFTPAGSSEKIVGKYVAQITQDGNLVRLNGGNEFSVSDKVIRGDFEFTKVDFETRNPMAHIPFEITSKTTGESHKIMTDKNGYFSSASSYAAHSNNTNGGKSGDGLWFGLKEDGSAVEVNDAYGALPYDTYEIKELQCDLNKGKDLVTFEVTIKEDQPVVDIGQMDNKTIDLRTEALINETGSKNLPLSGMVTITDTVTYNNLTPGRTYRLKGVVMDKTTGKELLANGKSVTAEKEFTPESTSGTVKMTFELDAAKVVNTQLVVFEKLYFGILEFASHEDLKDKNQTLYAPEISTAAFDQATNTQQAQVTEEITGIDKVTYKNLEANKEYLLKATLMDQETGETLSVAGKPVTAEKTFTPKKTEGQIEVELTFSSSELKGKTIVVFEELYEKGTLITAHKDLKDKNQTLYFPEIKTTAKDGPTGESQVTVGQKSTIIDTVTYKNLIPGKEYTIRGKLMKKSVESSKDPENEEVAAEKKRKTKAEAEETEGVRLVIDGKEVTSEVTFTPDAPDGSIDITFTFDSTVLNGETLVVFEDLLLNNVIVTAHTDINDEDQTVYVPHIKTAAIDKNTKDQIAELSKQTIIADIVTYQNLIIGKEYTIQGKLMSKTTGEALLVNGKEVLAETTFIPEAASGTVELTYELDTTSIAGETLVVFEDLYYGETLVYSHADIEDQEQTVYVPEIKTTATNKKDGEKQITASGTVSITDQLEYKNLIPGKEYTVKGVLMDEATGKELLVGGKSVTAEQVFTAEKSNGSVSIDFTFSATGLGDRTVVVFEKLYTMDTNTLIAAHEDLEDKGQTVILKKRIGRIGTRGSRSQFSGVKTGGVKTGDPTDILLYIILLIAAIGIGSVLVVKKRGKADEKKKL